MGQNKEIGFCQAYRQVVNLEYLSHIKSTFAGCNARPPILSPLEVLSGCVEWVSMNEVLSNKLGSFLCFTALAAKEICIHSLRDKGSVSKNLWNGKVTH